MQRIEIISNDVIQEDEIRLPIYRMSVSAGIPLPVDEGIDEEIDLNSFLVQHPNSTFFAKVVGNANSFEGIKDGDLLVVDSYRRPENNKFILVQINHNLAIRRYRTFDGQEYLETPAGQYLPIQSTFFDTLDFVGVITHLIHSY
jgi:DNA polymerase V